MLRLKGYINTFRMTSSICIAILAMYKRLLDSRAYDNHFT